MSRTLRSSHPATRRRLARGLFAFLVAATLATPLALGIADPSRGLVEQVSGLTAPFAADRQCDLPSPPQGTSISIDDNGGEDVDPRVLPDVEVALEPGDRYNVLFAQKHGYRVGDIYQGGRVVHVDNSIHMLTVLVGAESYPAFRTATTQDSRVIKCERDGTYHALFTPNDPLFTNTGHYGSAHVKLPQAWDTTLGTNNKQVCIVDTGVRYTHQDLGGARWLGGIDYVNNDNDPWDDHGHGTHVAGTAAATTNNALGVAGAAQVGIYAAKVLGAGGSGQWSWVASGITWCADAGADVISLSLGGGSASSAVHAAVQYAYNTKGALVVAASGNGGSCFNCVGYPAKYDEVIAVNCTDAAKNQCGFSSDGPESELSAPGASIISTCYASDTSYCSMSGTSMSTPLVSGVAALVWSAYPALTNAQLRVVLKCSAQDFGPAGWDEFYGHGIVNAQGALAAAANGCNGFPPPEHQCGAVFTIGGAPIGSFGYTGPTTLDVIHTPDDHVIWLTITYTVINNIDNNPGVTYTQVGTHPDKWSVVGHGPNTYQFTAHATLACGMTFKTTWTQTN